MLSAPMRVSETRSATVPQTAGVGLAEAEAAVQEGAVEAWRADQQLGRERVPASLLAEAQAALALEQHELTATNP